MVPINPIKRVRLAKKRTLEEFSDNIGVHLQAVYLNERGVYPTILPRILSYLFSLGEDITDLEREYNEYQLACRRQAGEYYKLGKYTPDMLGEPVTDEGHPFVIFRENLDKVNTPSRMAFAKNFCVHPASLYSLENSRTEHLPEQLVTALQVAGLPDIVLRELMNRVEEYVSGGFYERGSGEAEAV